MGRIKIREGMLYLNVKTGKIGHLSKRQVEEYNRYGFISTKPHKTYKKKNKR